MRARHRSQLTFSAIRQFHKLVVYLPGKNSCRTNVELSNITAPLRRRDSRHMSGHASGIVRTLLTPAEVATAYTREYVPRWSDDIPGKNRGIDHGQYLSGDYDRLRGVSFHYLKRLEHHEDEWDMSGITVP